MRIAFITNNYTPYAAGVVQSIDAVTDQLIKMGHDVLIIAPQFLTKHHDAAHVKRIPSLIRFIYKKKHMAVPWCAKYYLKKYLKEFKPDVVHVHHPFLLGAMGARIAREIGISVFFTYHTIYEDYIHYVPLPAWMVRPIVTKKVLNFCNKADWVITPSAGIKRYLHENGIDNAVVIPSPLRKEFCGLPVVQKKVVPPYNLLCVTRFAQEKNIYALFQVLEALPEHYYLTLVGYGDLEGDLRMKAAPLGDRVRFIIDPSGRQLLNAYQKAHLFLFPSYTDTQGLVIAESMACGTPVIALDGMGQRDSITNGENGFIVANTQEMAVRIQEVCSNASLYIRLQQAALNKAAAYSPLQVVSRLLALYEGSIKRGK